MTKKIFPLLLLLFFAGCAEFKYTRMNSEEALRVADFKKQTPSGLTLIAKDAEDGHIYFWICNGTARPVQMNYFLDEFAYYRGQEKYLLKVAGGIRNYPDYVNPRLCDVLMLYGDFQSRKNATAMYLRLGMERQDYLLLRVDAQN